MTKLFLGLINMSITASYVIIFIIIARLFLKRAPKVFSYAIWSVVLFRLICPFSFESFLSLIPTKTITVPQNIIYYQTPHINNRITIIDQAVNNPLPAPAIQEASVSTIGSLLSIAQVAWLIGIIILITYSIITTIRLAKKLKSSNHILDNVYENKEIETPFVFGLFKPRIFLPINLSEKEMGYILKHEQTHIKRFDHIVKPLAFLILCIHWLNPLVWIAFLLMCEDMELSCDESVIKQLGSEIKKDYSTSLLSLSTGRRIIGGCPLAFGESNTKGRIVNVLNYKKPAFWVVIVAVAIVFVVSFGLISNPRLGKSTVESYAKQFIEQEIEMYEKSDWSDFKIVENKITKLEKIASFDGIFSSTVEIWALEYRLKPDDITKVMFAGGMNEDEGWITEDSSMGKPLLIISLEGSRPKFLGIIRSGEVDMTTVAGKEMALRIFLESRGLIPNVTFKGNHVIVEVTLSNSEIVQLLLSQPVTQGDKGIWCVERWKDSNGNVYYVTPNTENRIADFYKELQKQSDNGNKTYLLDPKQVAYEFINNEYGHKYNEIIIKYNATLDDFTKTPESTFLGFISNFNKDSGTFYLNTAEWLTFDDEERLKELNIDPDNDMPNGFYIHEPNIDPIFCRVTDKTQYSIINWEDELKHKNVGVEEFLTYFNRFSSFTPPFWITIKDGYVQSIIEQYVP